MLDFVTDYRVHGISENGTNAVDLIVRVYIEELSMEGQEEWMPAGTAGDGGTARRCKVCQNGS